MCTRIALSWPLLERWSPEDSGAVVSLVVPCADGGLVARLPFLPSLSPRREQVLHFSAESLMSSKDRAWQELLAAGDSWGCRHDK